MHPNPVVGPTSPHAKPAPAARHTLGVCCGPGTARRISSSRAARARMRTGPLARPRLRRSSARRTRPPPPACPTSLRCGCPARGRGAQPSAATPDLPHLSRHSRPPLRVSSLRACPRDAWHAASVFPAAARIAGAARAVRPAPAPPKSRSPGPARRARRAAPRLDLGHVQEAGGAADQRAAGEREPRHRLQAALVERARAVRQARAAAQQRADARVRLPALELLVGVEVGIPVVQRHDQPGAPVRGIACRSGAAVRGRRTAPCMAGAHPRAQASSASRNARVVMPGERCPSAARRWGERQRRCAALAPQGPLLAQRKPVQRWPRP